MKIVFQLLRYDHLFLHSTGGVKSNENFQKEDKRIQICIYFVRLFLNVKYQVKKMVLICRYTLQFLWSLEHVAWAN